MIRVITQTTQERLEETIQLINQKRPLLDKGYSFNKALTEVTDLSVTNYRNGWFKDLIEYAKTQGYDYHEYKWKRGKDNNL